MKEARWLVQMSLGSPQDGLKRGHRSVLTYRAYVKEKKVAVEKLYFLGSRWSRDLYMAIFGDWHTGDHDSAWQSSPCPKIRRCGGIPIHIRRYQRDHLGPTFAAVSSREVGCKGCSGNTTVGATAYIGISQCLLCAGAPVSYHLSKQP